MSAIKRLGINPSELSSPDHNSIKQQQTMDTFSFEWSQQELSHNENLYNLRTNWINERYLDNEAEKLEQWLSGDRKIILEVGCGSGVSGMLFFKEHLHKHDYLGVDISDAVNIAKQEFEKKQYPGEFLQCDLNKLPIANGTLDMIFAEGVLHHTDNTKKAILNLSTKLKKGGRFLFYVYARKAVLREFTDDHIRNQLTPMDDEMAFEALKPLTELGIDLGKLDVDIDVKADIPYLGIKKGKLDLQRFFYWNIAKLFYDPNLSMEEMNLINFDWYRPHNCHRHTSEEVEAYCQEANLKIERMHVHEAGITIVAQKK